MDLNSDSEDTLSALISDHKHKSSEEVSNDWELICLDSDSDDCLLIENNVKAMKTRLKSTEEVITSNVNDSPEDNKQSVEQTVDSFKDHKSIIKSDVKSELTANIGTNGLFFGENVKQLDERFKKYFSPKKDSNLKTEPKIVKQLTEDKVFESNDKKCREISIQTDFVDKNLLIDCLSDQSDDQLDVSSDSDIT